MGHGFIEDGYEKAVQKLSGSCSVWDDGVWWAMVTTESAVVIFAVMCLRKADKDGLQGIKR